MRTLAPLALLLAGCTDGGPFGDDTGPTPTDSGTLDTDPHYEEGCIKVDGDGGYKYLADALKVADEGSTITLCEGVLEETVTITRSVTITAPTGADLEGVIWRAPSNEVAATISGAVGVGISGVSVESSRSGFKLDSATAVSFTNVAFTSIDGTAIQAVDSEGTVVDSCTFTAPQLGGVEINGGTADITGVTMDDPLGFGVKALGGATVSLSDSAITRANYTELTEDGGFVDGYAFWGTEDSTLVSTNNVFTDSLAGHWTDEAHLDSSADEIIGGFFGSRCYLGNCTVTGGTFTDNLAYGIVALNLGDGVAISETTVTGDPEVVLTDLDNGYSAGIVVQADGEVSVTDTSIIGHQASGMVSLPWNGDQSLTMTRVTMDDNGGNGLFLNDVDAVLEDVDVDNLRTVVDPLVDNGDGSTTITHGFAVAAFNGANVTWTGGGARNSELMNVVVLQATLVADDIELAGGEYFGVWNIEGDLTLKNSSVTDTPAGGGIFSQYGASLTLEGNHFSDSHAIYHWQYDYYGDGSYVLDYYYEDYSQDIVSVYDGPILISGNSFTDGSRGVQIYANSSDADIIDNSWQDYDQQAIYVSSQSSSAPVNIEDNSFERVGSYAIYCSYGTAIIKDVVVAGVPGYRSAFEYYVNGEFSYAQDATYYQPGIYSYQCDLELDNVSVSDAQENGIELSNSRLVMVDVSATGGSEQSYTQGAIVLSWTSSSPEAVAQGISVSDNTYGAGLYVVASTSTSYSAGSVSLSDVTVARSGGDGVVLQNLNDDDVELIDVDISESAGAGLVSSHADFTITGGTIYDNDGAGLDLDGDSSSREALAAVLDDLSVTGNGSDGVALSWATATLSGFSTTTNSGYGLVCSDTVVLTGCDDSDLSSNTEGAHCGCHSSCSELPGPLCPEGPEVDPPDTGDTGGDFDTGADTGA